MKMKKFFFQAIGAIVGVIALVALIILIVFGLGGGNDLTPCITDAGTMSYSPTVCEKYR